MKKFNNQLPYSRFTGAKCSKVFGRLFTKKNQGFIV